MHTSTILVWVLFLLNTGTIAAPGTFTMRQSTDSKIGLYLNGANFDIDYLQTLELSYANASVYVGRIKNQPYAEPLVVGNFNGDDNSISFVSTQKSGTGVQQMYVVPGDSKAVGFSLSDRSAPQGASTTDFSFGSNAELLHAGINRFFVCQNDALAPLDTYQIYWNAAGQPLGWTCQGPVKIQAGDV
ncbi:hypothetical protein H2200_005711 [Cladophialophora chaetospira]|uniref:DOMON domain-containing protein n=1 Tax=Cladophialophora chaetospira TaxID=386627 RepID=A0AA38X9K2_9EURO|nr:hypothetical protein H2200_005711 [Cladophialophora chaetospira]